LESDIISILLQPKDYKRTEIRPLRYQIKNRFEKLIFSFHIRLNLSSKSLKLKAMIEYIDKLKLLFEANENHENAPHMERYMKHRYRFYGLKKPARLAILKSFLQQEGLPKVENIEEFIQLLWNEEYRELHYIGCDILEQLLPQLPSDSIHLFEFMLVNQSWWDTVDRIAIRLVGEFFKRFPEIEDETNQRFINASNFWLNRTSIIYQLKYKSNTNLEILMSNILQVAHQKEFFIQKSIGWALREYSKTDASFVRDFVAKHEFASLSKREALKWLNNQMEKN